MGPELACSCSSRTEKGTDTRLNTLIDAIAASSLHIRLDSYSASPRRKRQGGAIQVPQGDGGRIGLAGGRVVAYDILTRKDQISVEYRVSPDGKTVKFEEEEEK
jgi:hypothetical protein